MAGLIPALPCRPSMTVIDSDLEYRVELLRKIMAEPMTAPKEVESGDDLYQWLRAKLEVYRRTRKEET